MRTTDIKIRQVRCPNPGFFKNITPGQTYDVLVQTKATITILCDDGINQIFPLNGFSGEPLWEIPDNSMEIDTESKPGSEKVEIIPIRLESGSTEIRLEAMKAMLSNETLMKDTLNCASIQMKPWQDLFVEDLNYLVSKIMGEGKFDWEEKSV